MNFFLYSGRGVSIVAHNFVKFIGAEDKIEQSSVRLTSFSGNEIETYGKICLPIRIAGLEVEYEFVIADFADAEILIGLNFMSEHGVIIDPRRKSVYTDKGSAKFVSRPKTLKSCKRIRCTKTVTIPAFSGMHIRGSFCDRSSCRDPDSYVGQLEPYYNTVASTGLLIAHSIANSEGGTGRIPIRVLNMTAEPITLYKRKFLGQFKPIYLGDRISKVTVLEDNNSNTGMPIVSHSDKCHEFEIKEWSKEELFKELKINSLKISENEKQQLKDICWENRTVFSTGSTI